jgi:hypothetical protein
MNGKEIRKAFVFQRKNKIIGSKKQFLTCQSKWVLESTVFKRFKQKSQKAFDKSIAVEGKTKERICFYKETKIAYGPRRKF